MKFLKDSKQNLLLYQKLERIPKRLRIPILPLLSVNTNGFTLKLETLGKRLHPRKLQKITRLYYALINPPPIHGKKNGLKFQQSQVNETPHQPYSHSDDWGKTIEWPEHRPQVNPP